MPHLHSRIAKLEAARPKLDIALAILHARRRPPLARSEITLQATALGRRILAARHRAFSTGTP